MSSALPVSGRPQTSLRNLFGVQASGLEFSSRIIHQKRHLRPGTALILRLGRYEAQAPSARPSFLKITREDDGLLWLTTYEYNNGGNEWAQQSFPLFPHETISVGRARNQLVNSNNPIVSGQHLTLAIEGDSTISIIDNQSSNGTYLAEASATPGTDHLIPLSYGAEGFPLAGKACNLSLSDGQNVQLSLGGVAAILYRQNSEAFVRAQGMRPQRLNDGPNIIGSNPNAENANIINVSDTRVSDRHLLIMASNSSNTTSLVLIDVSRNTCLIAAPPYETRISDLPSDLKLNFCPSVTEANPLPAEINLDEIENFAEGDLIAQQQVDISYAGRTYTLSLLNGNPVLAWQQMGEIRKLSMVNGFINDGNVRIMRMGNGKLRIGRTPTAYLDPGDPSSTLLHSLRPNDMFIVRIPRDEYVVIRSAELSEEDVPTYWIKCLTFNGIADNSIAEIEEGSEQAFGNLAVQRIDVGGQPGFRIQPLQNAPELPAPE
jgi:hypothetical protein